MKASEISLIITIAGEILLDRRAKCISKKKSFDQNPSTEADKESHRHLVQSLSRLRKIPVLSEEEDAFADRRNCSEYWLIDPLDGTKEYINGYDDFCINIALMRANEPVLALIYAPVLHELYIAEKGGGIQCMGVELPESLDKNRSVVVSRSHLSKQDEAFLEANSLTAIHRMGSALKFCRLATGQYSIYPRFQGSMEWDIAAGVLILQEAGGRVVDMKTVKSPQFNKPNLLNNSFIAMRRGLEFGDLSYPGY